MDTIKHWIGVDSSYLNGGHIVLRVLICALVFIFFVFISGISIRKPSSFDQLLSVSAVCILAFAVTSRSSFFIYLLP